MTVSFAMLNENPDTRPRHMVFQKMDSLMYFIRDPNRGIKLRPKKNSKSGVPNLFSGNDIVIWLAEERCNGDTGEALSLATFLCLYGYIYPVDLKTFTVKDDKSIFYRYQSPKYWPSNQIKVTNEQFIVYLLKRSKRNKQKHALEEYEQAALNKMQKVFGDMKTYQSLAETGIKELKQMRRDDKAISDAQERAFWRVQKPPPNQVKCLEEGPNHCFQPSQMQARRTKNKDFKLKEVHYLRQAIGRPRFKFSKCMECFLQRNDQYLEYDPLLNPLAVQPINPWFTDDKSIMDSHCKSAEVPTELRIKKWGLSFEDLLTDALGVHEFDLFLKKEYSQENLRFYQAVKELMVCPQSQVMSIKKDIESQFLTTGAPCEVNIDSKTMEIVNARLKEEKPTNMRYIFQPAVEHIYMLMKKDSYTRFLRSEQYKSMLVTAQTHNNVKKRLFNFGSNKKKTPSPQPRRRGSANSDKDLCGDTDIGGASYHSFSTGNLRELEDKPKKNLRESNVGSDSNIYVGQTASPSVRRRKEDDKVGNGQDSRRKSNLDVPRASGYVGVVTTPDLRKSEAVTPCLALSVPGKTNVVTPWEGES